jgi:hypothetical protein
VDRGLLAQVLCVIAQRTTGLVDLQGLHSWNIHRAIPHSKRIRPRGDGLGDGSGGAPWGGKEAARLRHRLGLAKRHGRAETIAGLDARCNLLRWIALGLIASLECQRPPRGGDHDDPGVGAGYAVGDDLLLARVRALPGKDSNPRGIIA